jgi:hypothetical protein
MDERKGMKTTIRTKNFAFLESKAESILALLPVAIFISCSSLIIVPHIFTASSTSYVITQPPSLGSDGKVYVAGVVKNNGIMPIEVVLGLNIVSKSLHSDLSATIEEPTYGKIIYPSNVSTYKFAVDHGWSVSGAPFILNAKPIYNPLSLLL